MGPWGQVGGGGGGDWRKAGVPSSSISGVIREEMAPALLQSFRPRTVTHVLC